MPTIPILTNLCVFTPNAVLRAKAFTLIEVVIGPINIALRLFKIIIFVIALMDFYILQVIVTQMQFVFQNALSPVDGGLSGDNYRLWGFHYLGLGVNKVEWFGW